MPPTINLSITVATIFISALAGVLVPVIFIPVTPRLTKIGNAFASGFLTSAAIVHLLPEAHEIMHHALDGRTDYPFDGVATLIGATVVFLVDSALRSNAFKTHTKQQESTSDDHYYSQHSTSIPLLKYNTFSASVASPSPSPTCQHQQQSSSRKSLAVILATTLSFHSLMEGLTLGASLLHSKQFTVIALAILAHKLFAALSLGTSLASSETSRKVSVLSALSFSLCTPLGAVIGALMATSSFQSALISATLTCMSAGVFLYVAFVDLLADEVRQCSDQHDEDRMLRSVIFVFSASAMSTLAIWT